MSDGVLKQHRDRMENDERYRESALSIDPNGPGGASLGKANASDVPTSLSVHDDQGSDVDETAGVAGRDTVQTDDDIDNLAGEDLEQAVRDADIAGRSEMTADEKRQALKDARSS